MRLSVRSEDPCLSVQRRPEVRLVGRSEAIRTIESRHRVRRPLRREGPDHRRDRRRQGSRRATDPSTQPRARLPLVTVNCAGLPDSLLESELFGHVRGSFTGAYRDKPGLLEIGAERHRLPRRSRRDEHADAGRAAALPRDRRDSARRRRPSRTRASTSALITATNRDLQSRISQSGAFREDLYFRLNVIRLVIPAAARADRRHSAARRPLPRLVCAPLSTACPAAVLRRRWTLLMAYRWPGNVRELKNVIERLVAEAGGTR